VTPKEQVELLMNDGIGFAETLLRKHGELFPFGVSMHSLGEIRHVNVYDGREQPPPAEVTSLLISALRQLADRGESNAVALFANVTIQDRAGEQIRDAIQVGLEHASGYRINVFFPYSLVDGEVEIGELFLGSHLSFPE